MTTNNKWEEEIRNKDLNGWNNWLIKLIQLEKEESYQRGKEETLEKVKEVIEKKYEKSIGELSLEEINIIEGILQELNKLK